jgi:hypothetical protein
LNFYIIKNPVQPWGDYGDILWSGMTCDLPRCGNALQLERTGPFVPSAFISGISDLIIHDRVKEQLEQKDLVGVGFREVTKARIVHLEWEKWDRTLEEPPEYPESGEPEDYILSRPHNAELSDSIGKLWEVCATKSAIVKGRQRYFLLGKYTVYLKQDSWKGEDFFSSKYLGYKFVTERAKDYFSQVAPGCLVFEEIAVT